MNPGFEIFFQDERESASEEINNEEINKNINEEVDENINSEDTESNSAENPNTVESESKGDSLNSDTDNKNRKNYKLDEKISL